MLFYDTHMHSHLSFDCFEDPVKYLTPETERITFTEHLDLANTANGGQDDIPDFNQTLEWKQVFKQQYKVDLLMGVEVGYVPSHLTRLQAILADHEFDLKLLSVHQNDQYDYMDGTVTESAEVMINAYLDQLIQALDEMTGCQIMTHFDYGFRIHPLRASDLVAYEPKLIQILTKCIKHGLAFELNSKSIVKYNNQFLYEWAIPQYQALGGTLFSLGSDAHRVSEHFMAFKELIELLEQFNVTEVAQFKGQELSLYPLEELKNFFN